MLEPDEYSVTVHRRGGKFIATIPQLRLVAKADTLAEAWRRIEEKKSALIEDFSAAGELDLLKNAAMSSPSIENPDRRGLKRLNMTVGGWLIAAILAISSLHYFFRDATPEIAAQSAAPRLISLPDGTIVPRGNNISGEVKRAQVRGNAIIFSGWAYDSENRASANEIRVYVNGELLGRSNPQLDPDARRSYPDNRIVPNWFNVSLPSLDVKRTDAVQIFAKERNGWRELAYDENFPFPTTPSFPLQISLLKRELKKMQHATSLAGGNEPARQPVAHIDYNSYGTTASTISTVLNVARRSEGAGIMGPSFTADHVGSRFLIRLRINGFVTENNEFVVAIFQTGRQDPVWLATRPVTAGQRVSIDETFEFMSTLVGKVELDVRIGVAQLGGSAFVNGTPAGADVPATASFIEIHAIN